MFYCDDCGVVEVPVEGIYCDGCCDAICKALFAEQEMNNRADEMAFEKHQDLMYSYAAQLYVF